MPAVATKNEIQTLNVHKEVLIDAPIDVVFETLLDPPGRFGEMSLTLEAWPGGRWYRDLGNNTGHLWGHVQVIKPPVLLELSGPLFMSYPALNHIEVKLDQRPGGTHVDFRHRAIGFIDPAHRQGVTTGWKHILDRVAEDCSAHEDEQGS